MATPSQVIVYLNNAAEFELLQEFLNTYKLSCSYDTIKSVGKPEATAMVYYKPSKESKEFWGAEYMTREGLLSSTDAKARLTKYTVQNGLLLTTGIALDETLRRILNTNATEIIWSDLHKYLASM